MFGKQTLAGSMMRHQGLEPHRGLSPRTYQKLSASMLRAVDKGSSNQTPLQGSPRLMQYGEGGHARTPPPPPHGRACVLSALP